MLKAFAIRLGLLSLLVVTLAIPIQAHARDLSGSFQGVSGHRTSGSVSIQKTAQGYILTLGRDFRFDGAPDPKLAFGRNGYARGTIFTRLASNSGQQRYRIPASLDPNQFTEVWLWCERFNVPLGVAQLR